jgi:MoaA/NifB/PqqE/SkfB family radical SAM enzyme
MPNSALKQQDDFEGILLGIVKKYGDKPLDLVISNATIRKSILEHADKKARILLSGDDRYPPKVQEDKYLMVRNLLLAADKAIERSKGASKVRLTIIKSLLRDGFFKEKNKIEEFQEKFGRQPPGFLTISPGKFCNLQCTGCYANSSCKSQSKLSWDVLDRIITEKTEFWGSYFTVISGGEPLLYQDQGKTILDIARKHPENYFLIYTNGTLIDKEMAQKIAEAGNIAPAISVEGFEKETDARRGPGMHRRILEAMRNLDEAGVPYGVSVTATKNNAELIVTDEFINYYFDGQGALFCWIFQLMPIGRAESLKLMVTPEQRLHMYKRTQELVRDQKRFIADFWNSGCVSDGCISAGKPGGYLYIEWNGNVTPCVFNPYSPVNINDVYQNGGNLNDVLNEPFFKDIRQWQKDYGFEKKPAEVGNWIAPCAIKDHYAMMRDLINKHSPKPIDDAAQKALDDPDYQKGLEEYGQKVIEATKPIWENEYLGSIKE